MTQLFRKRLIPDECIPLDQDRILYQDESKLISGWKTLHPKAAFASGFSYYVMNHGWKISKFFTQEHKLAYIYCDIIDVAHDAVLDKLVFTDLLADVIIENDGRVRVVDLDELADACQQQIISNDLLIIALHRLNDLLAIIDNGSFQQYISELDAYISLYND